MKKSQVVNYISLQLWEVLGNGTPTEAQIEIFEKALMKNPPDLIINLFHHYLTNLTKNHRAKLK